MLLVARPSGLSYGGTALQWPVNAYKEVPLTASSFLGSPDGAIFSVSPSLPSGLHINATDGTLYGTATAVTAAATYVVYANNSIGGTAISVSVVVDGKEEGGTFRQPCRCYDGANVYADTPLWILHEVTLRKN